MVSSGNDFVELDSECHVKEVDRLRRKDFVDDPLQNSKVVDVFGKQSPFQFAANPNTKIFVNVAFKIQQKMAIFWEDSVDLVVGEIDGGPHDSCRSAHGSAYQLQKEEISKLKSLFFVMILIAESTASTGKPKGSKPRLSKSSIHQVMTLMA